MSRHNEQFTTKPYPSPFINSNSSLSKFKFTNSQLVILASLAVRFSIIHNPIPLHWTLAVFSILGSDQNQNTSAFVESLSVFGS